MNELWPTRRFSLGVYVFRGAEVLDFGAPYGVFSIASRLAPGLEVFALGQSLEPIEVHPGLSVVPSFTLDNPPEMDALLLPGGPGVRREMTSEPLRLFLKSLPQECILASICSGSLMLGRMGFLDGVRATTRKEPDRGIFSSSQSSMLAALVDVAPDSRISHARIADGGRVITAGGASAGLELGLHLLRRAGHDESFVAEVARIMDYTIGYEMYVADLETCGR
jgi:transcriptional regulator GlxA family with amidase domain